MCIITVNGVFVQDSANSLFIFCCFQSELPWVRPFEFYSSCEINDNVCDYPREVVLMISLHFTIFLRFNSHSHWKYVTLRYQATLHDEHMYILFEDNPDEEYLRRDLEGSLYSVFKVHRVHYNHLQYCLSKENLLRRILSRAWPTLFLLDSKKISFVHYCFAGWWPEACAWAISCCWGTFSFYCLHWWDWCDWNQKVP